MNEMALCVDNYAESSVNSKIDFARKKDKFNIGFKNYSYQDFKEDLNIVCNLTFIIAYVCYGVLQFFATWAGLVTVFNHNSIVILLLSLGLGFFPFVGTFSGIGGACVAWDWSLSYSLLIFIAPYFIANGPLLLIAMVDIYKDWLRWKAEEKNN